MRMGSIFFVPRNALEAPTVAFTGPWHGRTGRRRKRALAPPLDVPARICFLVLGLVEAGMSQTALSFKQRKLIKQGRKREQGAREPNGRLSRSAKAKTDPVYSWLAPSIVEKMNKHPIDMLADLGAISADQRSAAFSWIADRAASGLPYVAPHGLNLTGVRAASEDYSSASSARRYNEVSHVLRNRCGVYGHTLAYEACIEGKRNSVIDGYFMRTMGKPAKDAAPAQKVAWEHLRMAFEQLEQYYAAQTRRGAKTGT